MTIRVFEAFAGVGSQRMALRNLGIDHEVVAIAEIDKFAIKSYEAIHGETNNLGDISQLGMEDIPDHDLFTYSFPCQDISVAGKGLGLDEGSDTRSGLLWECQKVIAGKKPKYLLLENVKNLVGKKHKHNFDKWLEWLEEQGYTNYWQVLNAKDYGVPQNRERVFVVSILGHHEPYEFPEPIELELRLKDVLEDVVDDKFYLDQEKVDKLIINSDKLAIGYIPRTNGTQHQSNTVYDQNKISPTLTAVDYKAPVKVLIKNATKKGYLEATHGDGVDLAYPDNETRRGRVQKGLSQTLDTGESKGVVIAASRGRNPENPSDRTVGSPTEQRLEINKQGTSNTITTVQKDNYVVEPSIITHNYTEQVKVRKHEVDIDALKNLLKSHKQASGKTNREISELLDEPMSLVEHWFRNDNSFAIPKEDKWLQLKEILSISTDSFDKQIMEFEVRDGVFDQANRAYDGNGISPTITATDGDKKVLTENTNNYRIRKLTPKECWRLMGFSDDDFHKAEKVNSNSQLYKQAGNSIVVDVLEGIFKQLLGEQ